MWNYPMFKDYRTQQEVATANWFKQKDYPVVYKAPFLLKKKEDWKLNILLPEVAEFVELQKIKAEAGNDPFALHDFVHHGLSSQAMLFNLLADSVMKKDAAFFSELFNYDDVNVNSESEFVLEYFNRETFNEKQKQPTSIDFAIKNGTGKNIFVEFKYTEAEFGGCSSLKYGECDGTNPANDNSLCYLHQIGRKYWTLMQKYGLDEAFTGDNICPFSIYYQFYRELMFALENNGWLVILIDKRNPAFQKQGSGGERGLVPTLIKKLPDNIKPVVKVLYLQEVVALLEKHNYTWIQDFKIKYGL